LNWKQTNIQLKEHSISILVLFFLSIVAFGTFKSTILSSDDWTFIAAKYAFGALKPLEIDGRRPLVLAYYYLVASLFGLRVEYYYTINFFILFLTALMVYVILIRCFPKLAWFAGLVAAVQLLYPVDYSRTWLIMSYIRFWWLVTLCAVWLFIGYMESGTLWKILLATMGVVVSLLAYEGQIGVVLLSGIIIAFLFLEKPVRRRLAVVGSVIFISISFLVWRFIVQPHFLNIKDAYVDSLDFSPALILERFRHGLDIFTWGWIITIRDLFQFQWGTFMPLVISFLIIYIIICISLFKIIFRDSPQDNAKIDLKIPRANFFLTLIPLGVAYWFTGYIPVIFLYSPSLQGNASRVNSFAIAGASLALVSIVAVLATFLAKSNVQIPYLTVVIIFPFILTSVFIQLQLNKEKQIAWETQKNIWSEVFRVVPGIRDGSKVVIIIPNYDHLRPLESPPFTSSWELDDGAKVLYNNPKIGGYLYYKDIQSTELLFTKNGFRSSSTDKIFPYKKLIFVYYNPQSGKVTLVENLKQTLSLPFSTSNYNPYENMSPANPSGSIFRWLVQ